MSTKTTRTSKNTPAVINALRAAKTRQFKAIDARVTSGEITVAQAAGFKSNVSRRTNARLAELGAR